MSTVTIEDLKRQFDEEAPTADRAVEPEVRPRIKTPEESQVVKQSKSKTLTTSKTKIIIYMSIVIVLQILLTSKWAMAFLARYIASPTIIRITTWSIFAILVIGLFFVISRQ